MPKIQIIEPKERYQTHKDAMRTTFFEKHGTFKTPNCFVCSEKSNSKYVKVNTFKIDFDPIHDEVVFEASCHDDLIQLRARLDWCLHQNQLDFRMVFKPKQATRINGKLYGFISRKREDDDTIAY